MRAHVALALLCLPCSLAVTAPCLWDSDTLDDELRGLPGAFDLVVGRWHRHGDAYYRARVAALLSRPSLRPADFDDLAVAHEHLGERTQAIAAMAKKCEALAGRDDRDAWYRYHANLGTLLAHDGNYDAATAELELAVAIEPAAHFGRERFQIELIRFARDAQRQPGLWRQGWLLRDVHLQRPDASIDGSEGVALDAMMARIAPPDVPWEELYTAVAGMLRFGGREGPELYRSLGLLFLNRGDLHLGWWALRRAIERGHPDGAGLRATLASIEHHWREANENTRAPNVPPDEELYRAVRANADAWLAAFQELETAAVAAGEDAGSDDVLRRLLAAADARVPPPSHVAPWWRQAAAWLRGRAGWIELFAAVVVLLIVRDGLRRRRWSVAAAVRT